MADRKRYFFVGIGGSGMMPLAMILARDYARVAGSDRSLDAGRIAAKFDALRALGIDLFPQDGSGVDSPDQWVIASAAIEETVPDIVAARRIGAVVMTRAQMLASMFNTRDLSIGVAGTSGKSTVTGMIGWILHAVGRQPTVMNGAVMKNFATPDAPFASALVGSRETFVSEIDESDGSIALFHNPRIAVLTNVSRDHKELEELRPLFRDFLKRAHTAVVNIDNAEAAALAPPHARTVGMHAAAQLRATDIDEHPYSVDFTVRYKSRHHRVELAVPGHHNVANALAALATVQAAGVPLKDAVAAIAGFTGLKRRFELVGEAHGIAVIDDFGHNPDKIAATLDTLHAFPGRLLLLFQPHGYGPLKVMRHDLVAMFAAKLRADDRLVLCDPVYHGGTTDRSVTSADIVADLAAQGGHAAHIADRAAAADHLVAIAQPGDRIVVMGARDDTLSLLAADMVAKLGARR